MLNILGIFLFLEEFKGLKLQDTVSDCEYFDQIELKEPNIGYETVYFDLGCFFPLWIAILYIGEWENCL